MELKTARLTLLIDPNKKAAFEHLCSQQDRTASQVVRQLIRDYLIKHGASYVASGAEGFEDDAEAAARSGAEPGPLRDAAAIGKAAKAATTSSGRRRGPRP